MPQTTIRLAVPDDAAGIATVHVKTWQFAYKGQIPNSYLDSLSVEKRTETWRTQLETPKEGVHTLVAQVDEQYSRLVYGWKKP